MERQQRTQLIKKPVFSAKNLPYPSATQKLEGESFTSPDFAKNAMMKFAVKGGISKWTENTYNSYSTRLSICSRSRK
jgi:hypothetical protein